MIMMRGRGVNNQESLADVICACPPSKAMAEPPREYIRAKAAAASPCMLTFVSSRM